MHPEQGNAFPPRRLDTSPGGSIVAGMNRLRVLISSVTISSLIALPACRSGAPQTATPPPDARRPVLKTEAELSAERAEQIEAGAVVPAEAPVIVTEQPAASDEPPPVRPVIVRPGRDSIRSDILMVNDTTLSVAEVLYPMRAWIVEARKNQTPRGFADQLQRHVSEYVRQEIGSLLVYEKALADLPEPQQAALDQAVDREIEARAAHDYGDSMARLQSHLQALGLTMEQFRAMARRQMLVSSYTREFLAPQIHVRRDELFARYRQNIAAYSTEETRELLMIEFPFERFLPEGVSWPAASESARASARLAAKRAADAAHAELAERPFADVARDRSQGYHAAAGGSWGQLGQPLQAPYDEASRLIFDFEEEQYSEPICLDNGWCIVGCGKIIPAVCTPFEDVQEQVREELERQRFNELAGDYILRLAETATISDLSAFVNAAVQRVVVEGWPERAAEQ